MKIVNWKEYLISNDLTLVDLIVILGRTNYDMYKLDPEYSLAQLAYARSLYILDKGDSDWYMVKYGLLWDYASMFPGDREEVFGYLQEKFGFDKKSAAFTATFRVFEASKDFSVYFLQAANLVPRGTGSHLTFLKDFYEGYGFV